MWVGAGPRSGSGCEVRIIRQCHYRPFFGTVAAMQRSARVSALMRPFWPRHLQSGFGVFTCPLEQKQGIDWHIMALRSIGWHGMAWHDMALRRVAFELNHVPWFKCGKEGAAW
ncbi:hypothetical protein B0I35DRAFT_428274 [Stachybotrys elegans]|uniref:Uncharacterized protein n=1 Tax=Stachybotrys elegans TaxID=80388 RepID=A0A8K0SS25_9HYPO|nr:hypothetical protein B0I35DRAFT_428274 [Stachybotrys elegans]